MKKVQLFKKNQAFITSSLHQGPIEHKPILRKKKKKKEKKKN
jgi:hypothetical protein